MVKKGLIWIAILLLILSSLLLYNEAKSSNDEGTKITLLDDNYQMVTVNDEENVCSISTRLKKIPEAFKKVAETEQLELYVEEETVGLAVVDKCNGYTWFSYDANSDLVAEGNSEDMIKYIKSGVSLMTYDKNTTVRRTVLDSDVEKTFENLDNGFKVKVDFTKAQIKFDLVVTLQEGDMLVRIPEESVNEYNPKLWKAGNSNISMNELIVYPFFGSTRAENGGYVVIPDGAGALVNLDEKPKHPGGYRAAVYGEDMGYQTTVLPGSQGLSVKPVERISLPIFGIIHRPNDAGLLVISENGSSYATYNYNSRDINTSYYQSYFTYNYRTEYAQFQSRSDQGQFVLAFQEKPNPINLVQRYVFLRDDKADYVGLAKKYQDFLVKKDGLEKSENHIMKNIPLKIDFINNEITTGELGVEDVATTTYEQAEELTSILLDKGYSNLNVTFKTFIQEQSSYGFEIMKNLGGKADFEKTLQFFSDHNINFNYYVDYAKSYYEKNAYTASKLNRQDFNVYNSEKLLMNFLNNPKFFKQLAEKDLKEFEKYNVQSVAIDGIKEALFTHFDKGEIISSIENMEYMKQLFLFLQENGIKTNAYTPDAYLFKYIDEYYHTPIVSSELMFIDQTVPLVQLVLSGYKDMYSPYMNFSSNDQDSMLKLVEFGVFPSFVLTGESTYNLKSTASGDIYVSEMNYIGKRIDDYYQFVNGALNDVAGLEMVDHTIVDPGVVKVRYENGIEILINYNGTDYLYGDTKIQAKGFVIL